MALIVKNLATPAQDGSCVLGHACVCWVYSHFFVGVFERECKGTVVLRHMHLPRA